MLELAELRAGRRAAAPARVRVALAQRAADPERALGVVVGDDDRARPAVGRLVLRGHRRVRDRLPRVPAEVERLREQRRRRVGDRRGAVRGHGTILTAIPR